MESVATKPTESADQAVSADRSETTSRRRSGGWRDTERVYLTEAGLAYLDGYKDAQANDSPPASIGVD